MSEAKTQSRSDALLAEEAREAERRMARSFVVGIPIVTVGAAVVVGAMSSLAPAILTLGGGVILGTIAMLWASLRTLTGDAPLPRALEHVTMSRIGVDEKVSRKRMLLRALKDLEVEQKIGKLDDEDYEIVSARYRAELKALMKSMDDELEPYRAKAEAALAAHLAKAGLAGEESPGEIRQAAAESADAESEPEDAAPGDGRLICPKCEASNEPDARFCKGCATSLGSEGGASGDA